MTPTKQSDTPRTDEQVNGKPCTRFSILVGDSLRDAYVPSDFARTLERELAAYRACAERLADGVRTIATSKPHIAEPLDYSEEHGMLQGYAADLVAEFDRLTKGEGK